MRERECGCCFVTLVVEPFQAVRALRALLVAQERWKTSDRQVTIKLAPCERLDAMDSARYVMPFNYAHLRRRTTGWGEAIRQQLPQQFQHNLERIMAEKYKISIGF